MHDAGDVEVDGEGGRVGDVLLDVGVLADADPDAPAVDLQRNYAPAGGEVVRLLAAQIGLAIHDCATCCAHQQHSDMDVAVLACNRRSHERDAVGLRAC
jgi:hypothetical protein